MRWGHGPMPSGRFPIPAMTPDLQHRLIFLISAPRSGSTLLSRILHGTAAVHSRPEPHLLTPLAHLGPWERVEQAAYDPIISQRAMRDLLRDLPNGDRVHLDACRRYADTVYASLLAQGNKPFFLDKTPAYALILPFVRALYPQARFVVLTRHPAAIFSSYAASFFQGDFEAAHRFRPLLSQYVPPIAHILTDPPAHLHHLRFEDLVETPEASLAALSDFLQTPLDPAALQYGDHPMAGKGPQDPTGVPRFQSPQPARATAWMAAYHDRPDRRRIVERQLEGISDAELARWGVSRDALWTASAPQVSGSQHNTPLTRQVLLAGRRLTRRPAVRRTVQWLRDACDVLLRG